MKKYYYFVNTLKKGEPVQVEGYIEAKNEFDVVKTLIEEDKIYSKGYEFLDLKECGDVE